MTDSPVQQLEQALTRYFDLMHDSDISRFDRVFEVPSPDRSTRAEILAIRSARLPLDPGVDLLVPSAEKQDGLPDRTTHASPRLTQVACHIATRVRSAHDFD